LYHYYGSDKKVVNLIFNIVNRRNKCDKKAQVWVETVIYTLIGLTIIGLLLAVSKPQFDRQRDRALIEQSINSIGTIDEAIFFVLRGPGNKRPISLKISSGELKIDGEGDKISWELDSTYKYSEEGITVRSGKINVTTLSGSPYKVILETSFPFNIQFYGEDNVKIFGPSSTPHVLSVENMGLVGGRTIINFEEV
jgi:hypothetical protein